MIRAICSLAAIVVSTLLVGVASAQTPSAPPTPAQTGAATQPAPMAAPATVDPEVVWLRKRVEQLEGQLMSGANCPGMGGMRQGQPMGHGQQHGAPMGPSTTPPPSPQPMPPTPRGGHM